MNFKFLNLSDHDIKKASKEIKSEGFYVFDNLISGDIVETLKIFWKSKFKSLINERPKANAVRGNLHLGEIDFDTFSNNEEWNIFRQFYFYWNKSEFNEINLTKEISIELHKLRNLIDKKFESDAITYNEEGKGIYLSVSHYPPKTGFLRPHSDEHPENKDSILQYMVNITHKNIDYLDGGLFLIKEGNEIDIDLMLKPGSVIFFDGALEHGVKPVKSNSQIGRLAFFAIPTYFIRNKDIPPFLRFLEKIYLGIQRRL